MGGYAGNINGYLPEEYYGAVQGIGTLEGENLRIFAAVDQLHIPAVIAEAVDFSLGQN